MMIGMMGLGLAVPLVLIGLLAYALGWRPQAGGTGPAQSSQTPLEILEARYSRGEISREEFAQIRLDLES